MLCQQRQQRTRAVVAQVLLEVLQRQAALAVKALLFYAHQTQIVFQLASPVQLLRNQRVFMFLLLTTAAQLSGACNGLFCKNRKQHSHRSDCNKQLDLR
jgi:hypothetical protein